MAELVLQSVVDAAAEHLLSLIEREIGQAFGVKDELEKLRMSVSAISAVLHDAERAQTTNAQVKDWLKKLQDVVYDADDLLDDFSTEVLHRKLMKGNRALKGVRIFFSSSNQIAYRVKMAHQVRAIRGRLDAISGDRSNFHMDNVRNPTLESKIIASRMARDGVSFIRETNVIGREKDKEQIIGFLLDPSLEEDNTNVSVLPIVGVGGLGKTTLAKLVFNETRVREYFHLKLWVCVSTDFDIEIIVKNILKECDIPIKELDDLNNMNKRQKKLQEVMDGKKYLLVLDDVWNDNRNQWLELKQFLTNDAKGSKILVTTRSQKVAIVTAVTHPYMLNGLPEDVGLCLLMQMARKQEGEWKGNRLETIGREIVRKCVGVPLAIKTIGRLLLSSENTEQVWLSFKENDLWRIDQEVDDIMPTLKLSYDYLPSHLKPCLAYCSLYPEDHPLVPQELIDLWISQGFIIKSTLGNKRSSEEAGHEYFMELVWRSFFQDFEEDERGSIVKCKMHDLIHKLARLVAGDNYITVDRSNADNERIPGVARHASTAFTLQKIEWGSKWKKLRSFLNLGHENWDISPHVMSSLTNVRALVVQTRYQNRIPDSIGKLKHLRYLNLSNSGVGLIPNSICKLRNLETLNLMGCCNLIELPRGITSLVSLRKLDIRGCHHLRYLPSGIGKKTRLRVLNDGLILGTSVGGDKRAAGLEELSKFQGLEQKKVLIVRDLGKVWDRRSSRRSLQKIDEQCQLWLQETSTSESIVYSWRQWGFQVLNNAVRAMFERLEVSPLFEGLLSIEYYRGDELPSWIAPRLKCLSRLEMIGCALCTTLPPVHQLPLLKDLRIERCGFRFSGTTAAAVTEEAEPFFPSLTKLTLYSLDNFKGWKKLKNNFEEEGTEFTSIPFFNNRMQVVIEDCQILSYLYGNHLYLARIVNTTLHEFAAIATDGGQQHTEVDDDSSNMLLPVSLIPFPELESITISPPPLREHDIVKSFPLAFFKPLQSLQHLKIENCMYLKSLPMITILQHLTALQTLSIVNCSDLDLQVVEEEDLATTASRTISSLLSCCGLKELRIQGLRQLKLLPWWIQHLSNLERLSIIFCKNLETLPELFRMQLSSLVYLKIQYCNTLVEWYRKELGEDWPNTLELIYSYYGPNQVVHYRTGRVVFI